jgi:uncharacterized protein YndB with AHSA1/START domain
MERSIVINKPVEDVFALAMDSARWAQWNQELIQVEKTSEGPVGVGATYRGIADFMGRMEWRATITEYEPPKRVTQQMSVGPVQVEGSWLFEPAEEGTRFILRTGGEIGGLLALAGPLIESALKRRVEDNLARLKAMVEEEDRNT